MLPANCCPCPVSTPSGHSVPWNVPITHSHIICNLVDQRPDMKHPHKRQIWFPANCQPQARLKPKRCLGGFIFTLTNNNNNNNNKTTFVSYLNSPRKGCPRGMNICVWTHLGLMKWKCGRKKKMEEDLKN